MSTSTGRRGGIPSRIARLVGNLTMTVVLLICLAWVVSGVLGYSRYVITGGSMSGTFEKGSIAFEQQVPVGDLRVGDVITYQPPAGSDVHNLVTHRIVSITSTPGKPTSYRTKGDANASVDPWKFSLDQGSQPVVRFTVPSVGYAFVALSHRETRMLLIGVPAGLIGLISLAELFGLGRKGRDEHAEVDVEATEPAQPVALAVTGSRHWAAPAAGPHGPAAPKPPGPRCFPGRAGPVPRSRPGDLGCPLLPNCGSREHPALTTPAPRLPSVDHTITEKDSCAAHRSPSSPWPSWPRCWASGCRASPRPPSPRRAGRPDPSPQRPTGRRRRSR